MLRRTGGGARVHIGIEHVAGEDLFRHGHGALRCLDGREEHFLLQSRHVEGKQAAVFDHLPRDFIFAAGKFRERDFLSCPDFFDQREVGRGQQAQVLAVLFVNALDVLGDHQLDPGAHLGVRRLLPAGAFASPLAADGAYEAALLYVASSDGQHVAALQAQVRDLAQGLVEIEAVVRGRDLVGRDVVAQLGIVGGIPGVPGQVFAGQLAPDQFRVFGEEKNAPLQTNFVGTFVDLSIQQRMITSSILRLGRQRIGQNAAGLAQKATTEDTRAFHLPILCVLRG